MWGVSPVFTSGFWKSCICTCQIKKHHCDSERIGYTLLMGLCWSSNEGRIYKWNTWSNPPYHIYYTCCHDYLLFLMTWESCLSVRDSHNDVSFHLVNTWILLVFAKLYYWTSSSDVLSIFPLKLSLSYLLRLSYAFKQVSCCNNFPIWYVFGCTWSYDWKLYNCFSISEQYFHPYISGQDIPLQPWVTFYKQKLLRDTFHETWVSTNNSSTCISYGNFWWCGQ